jgi:hypothetical protein
LNIRALQSLWLLYGLWRDHCRVKLAQERRTMHDMERDLERLDQALREAPALSADLFCDVTGHCARLPSLRQSGKTTKLDRMIEAGAWTDALIALIGLELPNWSIRRIVCEDGEWHCSLSRHSNLPTFLDESAEGSHTVLALAMLRAFVAALCGGRVVQQVGAPVPRVGSASAVLFCCDDFA